MSASCLPGASRGPEGNFPSGPRLDAERSSGCRLSPARRSCSGGLGMVLILGLGEAQALALSDSTQDLRIDLVFEAQLDRSPRWRRLGIFVHDVSDLLAGLLEHRL